MDTNNDSRYLRPRPYTYKVVIHNAQTYRTVATYDRLDLAEKYAAIIKQSDAEVYVLFGGDK